MQLAAHESGRAMRTCSKEGRLRPNCGRIAWNHSRRNARHGAMHPFYREAVTGQSVSQYYAPIITLHMEFITLPYESTHARAVRAALMIDDAQGGAWTLASPPTPLSSESRFPFPPSSSPSSILLEGK